MFKTFLIPDMVACCVNIYGGGIHIVDTRFADPGSVGGIFRIDDNKRGMITVFEYGNAFYDDRSRLLICQQPSYQRDRRQ